MPAKKNADLPNEPVGPVLSPVPPTPSAQLSTPATPPATPMPVNPPKALTPGDERTWGCWLT